MIKRVAVHRANGSGGFLCQPVWLQPGRRAHKGISFHSYRIALGWHLRWSLWSRSCCSAARIPANLPGISTTLISGCDFIHLAVIKFLGGWDAFGLLSRVDKGVRPDHTGQVWPSAIPTYADQIPPVLSSINCLFYSISISKYQRNAIFFMVSTESWLYDTRIRQAPWVDQ